MNIYRILHPTSAEYTFFLSSHKIVTKMITTFWILKHTLTFEIIEII